ncbi:SMI1/KNR4 family protein [Paenibacillus taiwanensis]|uniref:SMI1/KNR4 family protein n=1 Tax=Paenibacillus taiwanensis TaxID=401638 RepID=UPI0003FB5A12|nr:SMI1/KNR4 family protein [Paenibacillus taiwanensis]
MNWKTVFEVCYQEFPGITEQQLEMVLNSWNKPLSKEEIMDISKRQCNPFPKSDPMYPLYKPFDPAKWTIPTNRLPASYLDLLRYCNGGEFATGERHFQFFSGDELRAMLLAYEFPQYMPGAVPFAMDGCGHHYVWDMRSDQNQAEYPILVAHSGNLGYEDALPIAGTLIELCKGTISVENLLYE